MRGFYANPYREPVGVVRCQPKIKKADSFLGALCLHGKIYLVALTVKAICSDFTTPDISSTYLTWIPGELWKMASALDSVKTGSLQWMVQEIP